MVVGVYETLWARDGASPEGYWEDVPDGLVPIFLGPFNAPSFALFITDEQTIDTIAAGALVEVIDDAPAWLLLAPAGGGLELEFEDAPLTVLTPDSSLYGELLGLHVGDALDSPPLTITEVR